MKRLSIYLIMFAATLFCNTSLFAEDVVDAGTLNNKIMAGYQGWFNAPGDGNKYGWIHWAGNGTPSADNISFDMWPDMREFDADELFETNFVYKDFSNAGLYSAYKRKTVERHVKWMQDYGIDGVFVQRFISSALGRRDQRDTVLQNVKYGAEKHGRVFANMYDLSGCKVSVVEDIKKDWMHLVDDLKITKSANYLHHNGKPVLSLWGLNVGGSKGILTPQMAQELAKWLSEDAPEKYRVTLKAGVGNGWRGDDAEWQKAYDYFEVISPWSVGRYRDNNGADNYKTQYFKIDLEETASRGMEYIPVVFPGFSWSNLYPDDGGALNKIPRNGGNFLWRQFYNAIDAGCNMVYVAMFDEVDEGTAIYKVAENESQIPTTGKFVTLDMDGYKLPSDWYLRLTGEASKMLRGDISLTSNIPIVAYPNEAEFISQVSKTLMNTDESVEVSVTLKNVGTTSWTKAGNYSLTFDLSAGENRWGVDKVELITPETIAPNESKTFVFNIKAPATEGVYAFKWVLQKDDVTFDYSSEVRYISVGENMSLFDDCDSKEVWESQGTLALNTSDTKQGSAALEFTGGVGAITEFSKAFSSSYSFDATKNSAVLQFWYYCSEPTTIKNEVAIGLGSAGKAGENEYVWKKKGIAEGWNLLVLPLSDAVVTGSPDLKAINWFQLKSEKTGNTVSRIDEIQLLDKSMGASKYNLAISKGSGSGDYIEGDFVEITAEAALAGQEFVGWKIISGNPLIENVNAITTTLRMPAEHVELSAEYKILGIYLDDCDYLTGWGSSAGLILNKTDKKEGAACIEFSGNGVDEYKKNFTKPYNSGASKETGKLRFWYYTSNASLMGDNNQLEIGSAGSPDQNEYSWTILGLNDGWNQVTLDISAANVIGEPDLSAINWFRIYNFKSGDVVTRIDALEIIDEAAGSRHSLSVTGGSGAGNYYSGVQINILADAPEKGMFFDKWIVEEGNPSIEDILDQNTLLTMPDENVVVKASYKVAGKVRLTVENGTGSGEYDAGKLIMIRANPPSAGYKFEKWEIESGTPTISNPSASITFLTMGANNAVVKVVYKQIDTAVDKVEAKNKPFTLYPNPFVDDLMIRFDSEVGSNINVFVYDLHGKVVVAEQLSAQSTGEIVTLNLNYLRKGNYIARIVTADNEFSELITIK